MLKIYTDAAFRPGKQEGGLGIIIEADQRYLLKYYLASALDNHYLEFLALSKALDFLEQEGIEDKILTAYTDSQVLADSIEKRYAKTSAYSNILQKILQDLDKFDLYFINWIPEKANRGADHLARQALNREGQFISLVEK